MEEGFLFVREKGIRSPDTLHHVNSNGEWRRFVVIKGIKRQSIVTPELSEVQVQRIVLKVAACYVLLSPPLYSFTTRRNAISFFPDSFSPAHNYAYHRDFGDGTNRYNMGSDVDFRRRSWKQNKIIIKAKCKRQFVIPFRVIIIRLFVLEFLVAHSWFFTFVQS